MPGNLRQTLSSLPGQTRIPTFCWWYSTIYPASAKIGLYQMIQWMCSTNSESFMSLSDPLESKNMPLLRGWPQLTHPPQFGTSGTVTHWFTIDTPLIWNIKVCDTVLMIGLLCVKNLPRVSMGVSKLAIPMCHWCEMTAVKS